MQNSIDDRTIGPLLRRMRQEIISIYDRHSANLKINPIEAFLVRLLAHLEQADPQFLRGLTAVDIATFSIVMRSLRGKGFITSTQSQQDRRRRLFRLTEKGKNIAPVINDKIQIIEEEFLVPLAPREKRLFRRILQNLVIANALQGKVQQDPGVATFDKFELDIGTLFRRARQISTGLFEQECQSFSLSPLEHGALTIIGKVPGVKRADMPKALAIDRGTASATTKGLRIRGLVDILKQGKTTYFRLSAEGKATYDAMTIPVLRAETKLMSVLTKRERPQFMRLLRKLDRAFKN